MEEIITLKLKQDELNIVINALVQRPYGEVVNLLNNIHKQTTEKKEILNETKGTEKA